MIEKNFTLLFYLKKPKNYLKGSMPVYLRITVDGIREEISTGLQCAAETLKNTLRGTNEKSRMIIVIFQDHNDQMKSLVNKDFDPATLKTYTTSLRHTVNFIAWKYKVPDIDIRKLNYEFISNYHKAPSLKDLSGLCDFDISTILYHLFSAYSLPVISVQSLPVVDKH